MSTSFRTSGIPGYTSNRFAVHDGKVKLLDTLAILLGCRENLNGQLPDGKRPDIIRVNSKQGILFIGDGKNTESPNSQETQSRLLVYLIWLAAHLGRGGRQGIFSICFGNKLSTEKWVKTIVQLGRIAGIAFTYFGFEEFAPDKLVVWFSCTSDNQDPLG